MIKLSLAVLAVAVHLCCAEPRLEAVDDQLLLIVDSTADVKIVVEDGEDSESMSLVELFSRTAKLEAIVRELNATLRAQLAADCCHLLPSKADASDVLELATETKLKANQSSLETAQAQLATRVSQADFDAFANATSTSMQARATENLNAFEQVSTLLTGKANATRVALLEAAVQERALQTAFNTLSNTVASHDQAITLAQTTLETKANQSETATLALELSSKASTTDLEATNAATATLNTSMLALQTSLNGKASVTAVAAVQSAVVSLEASISTKAAQQDLATVNTTLQQLAGQQQSSASNLQSLAIRVDNKAETSALVATDSTLRGLLDGKVGPSELALALAKGQAAGALVNDTVNSQCSSVAQAGFVRFNTLSRDVEYCDGEGWELLSAPPLGSEDRPADSCAEVAANSLQSNINGKFYVADPFNSQARAVYTACTTRGGDTVSLGGNGQSRSAAGASCQVLADQWEIGSGVYYVIADAQATNLSQLAAVGVAQVFCSVQGSQVSSLYDGSTEAASAPNCSFVKSVFNRTSTGVFWINGQQTLCDLVHPDGVPLGGAGTSIATAAASCETLRQFRASLAQSLTSAVYFISVGGGAVQVYCKLDVTPAVSMGGDGSTQALATASCAFAKSHFAKSSGALWVDPDSDASATSNARQRQCFNGVEVGGLGTSVADAARSCRHLDLISMPTGAYWLNPTGSSTFQAYCLQSDGGKSMATSVLACFLLDVPAVLLQVVG